MTENEISKIVFEYGLKIHRKLGIGLYESIYEECLFYELKKAEVKVERQKPLNIQYEELLLENAFRMDLLIENKVVLEIKSILKAFSKTPSMVTIPSKLNSFFGASCGCCVSVG